MFQSGVQMSKNVHTYVLHLKSHFPYTYYLLHLSKASKKKYKEIC